MFYRLLLALLMMVALRAPAATISKGFDEFYNLDYDAAIVEFKKQISADPENPARYDDLAMGSSIGRCSVSARSRAKW